MNIKNRLQKLESKAGGGMPEVIVAYMDGGKVEKCETHPELTGKTEAEIDAFSARGDVLLVKVVYASQDNEQE
jgi:hypothetical protein